MNNVLHFAKLFAVSYPLFILFDCIWLGVIMSSTYRQQLGYLYNFSTNGSLSVNWLAALAVWAFIVLGAIIFVLPLVDKTSYVSALTYGALYGLILYGVYDLTNLAFIRGWPWYITGVDMLWGMVVNALLVVALTFIERHLL